MSSLFLGLTICFINSQHHAVNLLAVQFRYGEFPAFSQHLNDTEAP